MGHVYVNYNNKTNDGGCLQSGCGCIILLVLLVFAIRGCVAFIEHPPATARAALPATGR